MRRYILPSSCSIYGFQDKDVVVDETWTTNPLTTYAVANERVTSSGSSVIRRTVDVRSARPGRQSWPVWRRNAALSQ